MSITNFLNVSTAHLSPAARAWLSANAAENFAANYHGLAASHGAISTLGTTRNGWFSWIPQADVCEQLQAPADLMPVFDAARKADCNYVLFDSDAELIPGLAHYSDDGELIPAEEGTTRKFCVTLKESVTYTVEVDAFDDDHAEQLALDMWAASQDPTADYDGNGQGVRVYDCEEMGPVQNG